jgi:aminomethyltransferase
MQEIVEEPESSNNLKILPLRSFHEKLGAKFTSFASWEMPLSYGRSVDEHMAARNASAAFDVSHMGEIQVHGGDAGPFLDFALTNWISTADVGQAVYSPMCDETGGVIDDLIACKRSNEDYLLCVNASNVGTDFDYLKNLALGFACEVVDQSQAYGQLAVQGPDALAIVSQSAGVDLGVIRKMHFTELEVFDSPVLLARSGYTGGDGFEIYCQSEALDLWAEALVQASESYSLRWAGLAARDSLRLEAGLPLHGHELSDQISPVQAGMGWSVKFDKPSGFVGRESLLSEKENGFAGHLGHYVVEGRRIPREGDTIMFEGISVGRVTSGGYSPLLGKPIGIAWISSEYWTQRMNPGWSAEVRGRPVSISVGKPALYR